MRIILKSLVPLLITLIFVYLPYLTNLPLLTERNNDLAEFFWPIFYYIKQNILINHQIPFWNNMFFSGTPLLPDPQNPTWYLPNTIFLFMPLDYAILLSFILHGLFGGIGAYLASRSFGFSRNASLFASCLFIAAPKLSRYIEAGHYGLVISFAWLPYLTYGTYKLARSPKLIWAILFAISFASIYFNHVPTALIAFLAAFFFWLVVTKEASVKAFSFFTVAAMLSVGFIAVALIPQLEWQRETTRDLLLKYPDIYPKWNSKVEFLKNIIVPWLDNPSQKIDTEKWIAIGILPALLSFVGFIRLKIRCRLSLLLTFLVISLISLNNASPIASQLSKINWLVLLRVTTRFWFVIVLVSIFLAGYGFDYLLKRKRVATLVFVVGVAESIILGYFVISKPINVGSNKVSGQVYEFLSQDKNEVFRVFCTTRCLSQRKSVIYNLRLAEGYGTLQQKNYYRAGMQIGQYFWDRYTLSIPPFEIYLYSKLQPHAPTLAAYSIKYVVSPHSLSDKNLTLVKNIDNFLIYQNGLYTKTNYLIYTPNHIRVATQKNSSELIIPEVYNKNWIAYRDGKEKVDVGETKDGLREVKIMSETQFVDFKYLPLSFKIGLTATAMTILGFIFIYLCSKKLSETIGRFL